MNDGSDVESWKYGKCRATTKTRGCIAIRILHHRLSLEYLDPFIEVFLISLLIDT